MRSEPSSEVGVLLLEKIRPRKLAAAPLAILRWQQVYNGTHVTPGRILTFESVRLAFERPASGLKLTMNRLKDHKKPLESNFGSFELLSSAVGTKFLKKFQQQHQ